MKFLIILLGASIGQMLLILVRSYMVQESSKYQLNFRQAFKVYTTKYVGPILIGYVVIFGAMYMLPDLIANNTDTRFGLKVQHVLNYLRSWSIVLGVISQGLGFLIVRKGAKYLKDEEAKINDNV